MLSTELLLTIFTVFVAIIGFFLQRILNKTDEISEVRKDVSEIKPKVEILWDGIKELKSDFDRMEARTQVHEIRLNLIAHKLDIEWRGEYSKINSPRVMNEKGEKIFEASDIAVIVDKKLDKLIDEIREMAPRADFELEEDAERVMMELKADEKIKNYLDHKAYEIGTDVDSILFVGSLYLRDKAKPEFNFPDPPDLEDILDDEGEIEEDMEEEINDTSYPPQH